jgi:hypothetical protein
MALDSIKHFSTHDFFDSELLIFNYDKANKQLKLKCNYVLDRIAAVLTQENASDFNDFHEYIFHNVKALRRRNVEAFLAKKNNIDTMLDQISISLDTISIKQENDGFKIKIAFLDAFGDTYFQCEHIDFQRMSN